MNQRPCLPPVALSDVSAAGLNLQPPLLAWSVKGADIRLKEAVSVSGLLIRLSNLIPCRRIPRLKQLQPTPGVVRNQSHTWPPITRKCSDTHCSTMDRGSSRIHTTSWKLVEASHYTYFLFTVCTSADVLPTLAIALCWRQRDSYVLLHKGWKLFVLGTLWNRKQQTLKQDLDALLT